jgi:hypothetical protein
MVPASLTICKIIWITGAYRAAGNSKCVWMVSNVAYTDTSNRFVTNCGIEFNVDIFDSKC